MLTSRLKNLRVAREMSQKDFARAIGVSQQTVASWEVGRTEPANNTLKDIATFFNVSTDYLLGNDGKKTQNPLSEEQKELINGFGRLNTDGKSLILNMINQLGGTRSTGTGNMRVIGNKVHGNNYFSNNNNSFNTTAV